MDAIAGDGEDFGAAAPCSIAARRPRKMAAIAVDGDDFGRRPLLSPTEEIHPYAPSPQHSPPEAAAAEHEQQRGFIHGRQKLTYGVDLDHFRCLAAISEICLAKNNLLDSPLSFVKKYFMEWLVNMGKPDQGEVT
ncbi:hypothetical protein BAE44_0017944 [Dichanthelium oligosanthes]|uniref:Uncharacterized protein n=1 Tax=Dichanthelium oligosanthes TaxID=888268 RepID=A0A1E5V789_9POAL|nr:hypothetical protein BAE44_0017944 [Dichanthelium oligosanthes]